MLSQVDDDTIVVSNDRPIATWAQIPILSNVEHILEYINVVTATSTTRSLNEIPYLIMKYKWNHEPRSGSAYHIKYLTKENGSMLNLDNEIFQNFTMNEDPVEHFSPSTWQDNSQLYDKPWIIILAYMHTGSSYTAALLSEHSNDVFYVEPLKFLQDSFFMGTGLITQDGKVTKALDEEEYTRIGSELAIDLLSCNYEKLDLLTLWKAYTSMKTKYMPQMCKSITSCSVLKRHATLTYNEVAEPLQSCVPTFRDKCLNQTFRAFKSIRMSMKMAEGVLNKLQNIKIIHLLRDPRGMINSNIKRKEFGLKNNRTNLKKRAEYFCKTMLDDYKLSYSLKKRYPGKIITLRNEDMTEFPMETAKRIYEFVDLPFTKRVQNFVRRVNGENLEQSRERASSWRNSFAEDHLNLVNRCCSKLYKEFGYSQLKTLDEVRNLSIPAYIRKSFDWS
ncbi:chondroitin 6-sulfotransferase [Mactra antiquata]